MMMTVEKQEAQLSQRYRAAGCVSFGQKWKNGTGRRYFADIFNHCDRIGLKAVEFGGKKTQNKG